MATRKKKQIDNSGVVKGNHLTVITFSDGRTVLEWDDEALLKEVREALKSVEVPKTKTKRKTKEKQ